MLDFKMKHEGEPPARIMAQARIKFAAAGLPKFFADHLAPYMQDVEDIDPELLEQLKSVVELFDMHKIPAAEAVQIFQKVLEDLHSGQDEGETPPPMESAWPGSRSRDHKKPGAILGSVIEHLRAQGPSTVQHHGYVREARSPESARVQRIEAMADGLLARMDRKHTPTIGRQYAQLSLGELAMACARAAGHRPMNLQEGVRLAASHSTSDFPLVLENALGKSVGRQMEQVMPALARAAHEIPAMDYRGGNLLGLSASGMPEEIGEGGEIKYVTIDDRGERKPAPRDFGAIFAMTNKAIYNDDLGMLTGQIGRQMVAGANERFRRVLLEPLLAGSGLGHLMADGKTVFHADHGNLAFSGAAINVTSLNAARVALRSQRGSQGEYYAIEPWALVVPPQLETTAQQVQADINATKVSDVNPFSGTLELIVEPGLTSATAWYLIGNPATTDGLAYAFLDGQKAPKVESKPGWNTLGIEFRLVWALDARFVSYASWYRNPGA